LCPVPYPSVSLINARGGKEEGRREGRGEYVITDLVSVPGGGGGERRRRIFGGGVLTIT
jgi:hypothetical protein